MRPNAENCREDSNPEKLGDVMTTDSHDFCGILVVSCHVEGILNVNVHPLPSALFSAQIVPL
jgi:hypothetical protein